MVTWEEIERDILDCSLCDDAYFPFPGYVGEYYYKSPVRVMFLGHCSDKRAYVPSADLAEQTQKYYYELLKCSTGRFLYNNFLHKVGLGWDKVAFLNVYKCLRQDGIAPNGTGISNCFPHTHKQIKILRPELIVVLGKPARLAIEGLVLDTIVYPITHPGSPNFPMEEREDAIAGMLEAYSAAQESLI